MHFLFSVSVFVVVGGGGEFVLAASDRCCHSC